jgi:hypothetical protein
VRKLDAGQPRVAAAGRVSRTEDQGKRRHTFSWRVSSQNGGQDRAAEAGRRRLTPGESTDTAGWASMLPQSSMLIWILGERFDVPEIQHLSSTERSSLSTLPQPAAARRLGFLYHEDGVRQDP